MARTKTQPGAVCTWTYDEHSDAWDGSCGAKWCFNTDGPRENNVRFCPECGRPVTVKESA